MIHYSSSFRDFLYRSDSRIAKILAKIDRHWRYYDDRYRSLITNEQIDYITFRSDGTISFLPAGKEHKENDDGQWARDGRQNGKPGKVIRKLFTQKLARLIPDKEFETFSNAYKAEYNGQDYEFTLLPSKKIPSVYGMSRAPGGRLGNSCMNDDTGYFDIYKNCKQLQILILKDKEGRLCGRSLVWSVSDEFILMDRIYTSKDFLDDMFVNYAIKQKWHYLEHYTSYEYKQNFMTPLGKAIRKKLRIDTDTEFDYYPYIDTFSYGGYGYLTNDDGAEYEYNCTDGNRSGGEDEEDDHEGEIYDEHADEWINEEDAVRIDHGRRSGQYVHRDSTVCDVNGDYWMDGSDGVVYVESRSQYYPADDCTYVESENEYFPSDECVYSEHSEEDLLRKDATEIDGKWYKDEDVVWCSRDSEDYLKDDCVETADDWILMDDAIQIRDEWYHKEDTVFSNYHDLNLPKDDCVFCYHLESWILKEDAIYIDGKWYHKSSKALAEQIINVA